MSEEFIKFIQGIVKDKELLQKKSFLEGVRENFYIQFPELKNSKWLLDANRLSDAEFEILLDQLKFYAKREITGYGPQFYFYLQVKCSKCGKELEAFERPFVINIKSLQKEITKKYQCAYC